VSHVDRVLSGCLVGAQVNHDDLFRNEVSRDDRLETESGGFAGIPGLQDDA
jgi:hypothetical protein